MYILLNLCMEIKLCYIYALSNVLSFYKPYKLSLLQYSVGRFCAGSIRFKMNLASCPRVLGCVI